MNEFNILNSKNSITVFTTRPDTIFGASFIAVSVDHEICNDLHKLVNSKNLRKNVQKLELLKRP